MRSALRLGFAHVAGTEYTPELVDGDRVVFAAAHDMPFADGTFDVVTMCDVIEHLLPGDDEAACRELARVATRHVLISANNLDSFGSDGSQLHINKRPYAEWDALFREWFAGCRVEWLKPPAKHSEFWRIDL